MTYLSICIGGCGGPYYVNVEVSGKVGELDGDWIMATLYHEATPPPSALI